MKVKQYDIGEPISEGAEPVPEEPKAVQTKAPVVATPKVEEPTPALKHEAFYKEFTDAADHLIKVCGDHEQIARTNMHRAIAGTFKNLAQDVQHAKSATKDSKYTQKLN